MLIQSSPPIHLTYCLNVHRGESWAENYAAIRDKATAVRDRVAPGVAFGLGLRIAHRAASELAASAQLRLEAQAFFAEQNLYVFTINGFPYGRFHDAGVKERVYAPDWRMTERRDYTNALAEILAEWLPEGMDGSISTVPGSFREWMQTADDEAQIARMLTECALYLHELEQRTGREIHVGLEPEPACFLETTPEAIRFFETLLLRSDPTHEAILRRHIGVCVDTCHVALQFEDAGESLDCFRRAGIRISKVQLSSALRADSTPAARNALRQYCEPVYLHQVKARMTDGSLAAWTDLPQAINELPSHDATELRVHFQKKGADLNIVFGLDRFSAGDALAIDIGAV